ncbi:MAG TPA: phage major capsid protein [Candidatus Paceibacterota bacterium]
MHKLLKLIKSLTAQGYASSAQKSEVAAKFKELESEEQEVIKDDVAKVDALPEEKPAEDDEDKELEKNIKMLVKGSAKAEVKEAVEGMKSEIKAWLETQKDAMNKSAGIYNPDVQAKRKSLNTYLRDFSSALLNNDVAQIQKVSGNLSTKELTTDATGSPYGGYVVESELSAEIRHLTGEYGVARREMTTVQLSKNSYEANTLVTDVTVYWVDEAGSIPSTQVVLGHAPLTLKKLAAIVTLTRELLEDSEIDLFAFIATRVAEGFARAEDAAFFVGDGTGTYGGFTGALNASGVNVVTKAVASTFSGITYDDLIAMQDATPEGALPNGKYYGNRTIVSNLRKLKDSAGQYIFADATQGNTATLLGRTFVSVEVMPVSSATAASTRFFMFADLKKSSIFGYKGAISADRFNAGIVRNVAANADINLITTDREAIRWVERVGAVTVMPAAITVLRTGAAS